MSISIFDLFSIGIGPSSSHTVGPMRAAAEYISSLPDDVLTRTQTIKVKLYGSLALTGKGHGTHLAVVLGLEGYSPATVDPQYVTTRFEDILNTQKLLLNQRKPITFDFEEDVAFLYKETLPYHANAMEFSVHDAAKNCLNAEVYYSIGGGFIEKEGATQTMDNTIESAIPHPFENAKQLLAICEETGLSISEIMLANEKTWRDEKAINTAIDNILSTMEICIDRGCQQTGQLPGILKVKRRAPDIFNKLQANVTGQPDKSDMMNWLNLYAIAVNEENAAGGRVVTAPTNGAAGVIPSVLRYYRLFCENATHEAQRAFLLTAAAIAILYKKGASISAAEVGCQGEIGVACSMAAGALAEILGGSPYQVEAAAEMAMEHNLGLTCDPIAGLVQIPCIERNAMGAVQAVNSARLALLENNTEHKVSLDDVIKVMFETGKNMQSKYKETAKGGLATAVHIPEC